MSALVLGAAFLIELKGVNGVEKRLEERWAEEEFLAFRQAAEKMRNVLKTL